MSTTKTKTRPYRSRSYTLSQAEAKKMMPALMQRCTKTDDCFLWDGTPFRGRCRWNYRGVMYLPQVVVWRAHGGVNDVNGIIRSTCGNTHCCAHSHLEYAPLQDAPEYKRVKGTAARERISNKLIQEIRTQVARTSVKRAAAHFGRSYTTIYEIASGERHPFGPWAPGADGPVGVKDRRHMSKKFRSDVDREAQEVVESALKGRHDDEPLVVITPHREQCGRCSGNLAALRDIQGILNDTAAIREVLTGGVESTLVRARLEEQVAELELVVRERVARLVVEMAGAEAEG